MRSPRAIPVLLSTLLLACKPTPPCKSLCRPSQLTTLDRIAGQPGGLGYVDGPRTLAHFQAPWQLVCAGNQVYVTEDGRETIRAIDLDTGLVSTLAGTPGGIGAHDGVGAEATFFGPSGMALKDGRLYVADVEHNLLRVLEPATRRVTTLAGKTSVGGQDGPVAQALFNEPEGLALEGDDLYVGDTDNSVVRKIALRDGMVSTAAGQLRNPGDRDGSATQAQFHKPMSLAADGEGHLYVADTLNLSVRTLLTRDGSVSTLARLPAVPLGLGVVGADLVVTLADSQIVRIDRKSGLVRPWLGAARQEGFVDAANGLDARFVRPAGVCLDGKGNLLVGDSGNQVVRSVSLATGAVSTFAGARSWGAEDGDGSSARFHGPRGLIWDGSGNYYVADSGNSTIRKVVLASGQVSTLAGSAGQIGSADGIGQAARFNHPRGLALDGAGRLYVADSDAPAIRAIDLATRAVTTIALVPDRGLRLSSPGGLVFTDGALWIADYDAEIVARLDPATGRLSLVAGKPFTLGNSEGVGGVARFNHPESLTSDGRGNLYVADVYNQSIRRIRIHDGSVTTIAGGQHNAGFGKEPVFNHPTHVVANGIGDLFVSDAGNNVIRRVELGSGRVTTIAGSWSNGGVQLGPLPAQLGATSALALSDDGRLALFSEDTLLLAR